MSPSYYLPFCLIACLGSAVAAPLPPISGCFTTAASGEPIFLASVDANSRIEVLWGSLGHTVNAESCQAEPVAGGLRFQGKKYHGSLRRLDANTLGLAMTDGKKPLSAQLVRANFNSEATRALLEPSKFYFEPSRPYKSLQFSSSTKAVVRSGNKETAVPYRVLWNGYVMLDGHLAKLTPGEMLLGRWRLSAHDSVPGTTQPVPARILQLTISGNGPVRVLINDRPVSFLELTSAKGGVASGPIARNLLNIGTNTITLEFGQVKPDFEVAARLEDLKVGEIVDSSAKSSSGKPPIFSTELTSASLNSQKAVQLKFQFSGP